MKSTWKIPDIIDLEYFLHQDSNEDEDILDQRDRKIFTRNITSDSVGNVKHPKMNNISVIREWLDVRRQMEKQAFENVLLPGNAYAEIYKTLKIVFAFSGLILGLGLVTTLLRYSGGEPINVAYYLGVLVLPQLALAILMIFFLSGGLIRPSQITTSPLYLWIGHLLAKGIEKIVNRIKQKMTGHQRETVEVVLDLVRLKNRIYGKLFLWPIFILVQILGVALNAGILSGTLIRVLGTDLAFGWQTTLNLAPGGVYKFVRILSLPWQWMAPGSVAHPSLDQIMGSRIILKEGIHSLTTQDLASWWPFLCFCILFYGLFPRGIFLILGVIAKARLLKRLKLLHADCERLMIRMTTPHIRSSGSQFPEGTPDEKIQTDAHQTDKGTQSRAKDRSYCLVLLSEDIGQNWTMEDLIHHFGKVLPSEHIDKKYISMDMDSDEDILDSILNRSQNKTLSVFILVEAWQPPIREMLVFLEGLRSKLKNNEMIILGLVGKPDGTKIFTKVGEDDFRVWKQKTLTLNDPYMLLERL